jgi:hypothetical protein
VGLTQSTPEVLDQIIRNSLALRLGDATFAGGTNGSAGFIRQMTSA